MKFILNLFAATLAAVGAITLVNLGIEKFSSEKVEKPSSYVYWSALKKANELCGTKGILSIGSTRSAKGATYHLKCSAEDEITFEDKH